MSALTLDQYSARFLEPRMRCLDCGYVGRTYCDRCDECRSRNLGELLCENCKLNDSMDGAHCYTCAITIDTDDLLVWSRNGSPVADDQVATIIEIVRCQAVRS